MSNKKLFTVFVAALICSSCASVFYSTQRELNNSFVLETNLPGVKVSSVKPGKNYQQELGETQIMSNQRFGLNYTFDRLRARQLKLELSGDNLESQYIKIKRTPRAGVIVMDVLLSPITFGLPILIDPFRPDFYKISKKSKNITVFLKYTQEYMLQEYKKIESSSKPEVFSEFITKYYYSNCVDLATNKKDSLEFNMALSKSNEKAIDEFISNHATSKFLPKAQTIKNEMAEARMAFDDAQKIDKASAFEAFIKKYPNSLHLKSARVKMMTVAERDCIKADKLDSTIYYLENYLDKYRNIIDENDFNIKSRKLEELLTKQIVIELDKNETDKYKAYKTLWEKYKSFENKYNFFSLNELESYGEKIYNLLFNKLAETKDEKSQVDFLSKAKNDFNSFFKANGWREDYPISFAIIFYSRKRNALVKLYNQNYLKYYYDYIGEGYPEFFDIYSYTYREKEYLVTKNYDYEEILFENDIYNKIKLLNKGQKVVETNLNPDKADFYLNGQLVKTKFYQFDNNGENKGYAYEFENGVNITLKELTQKLDNADKLLAQKNYQEAVNAYEECKNNLPYNIAENIRLSNSLSKANNLLNEYNRKQEEIRLAEERKKEQARLAEEKRLEQIRLAEEKKKKKDDYENAKFLGKWLCERKFRQNYNGTSFEVHFEPLENKYFEEGIAVFQINSKCPTAYFYDVINSKVVTKFYKSTCNIGSDNITFDVNIKENSISYYYKNQLFTLYAE